MKSFVFPSLLLCFLSPFSMGYATAPSSFENTNSDTETHAVLPTSAAAVSQAMDAAAYRVAIYGVLQNTAGLRPGNPLVKSVEHAGQLTAFSLPFQPSPVPTPSVPDPPVVSNENLQEEFDWGNITVVLDFDGDYMCSNHAANGHPFTLDLTPFEALEFQIEHWESYEIIICGHEPMVYIPELVSIGSLYPVLADTDPKRLVFAALNLKEKGVPVYSVPGPKLPINQQDHSRKVVLDQEGIRAKGTPELTYRLAGRTVV